MASASWMGTYYIPGYCSFLKLLRDYNNIDIIFSSYILYGFNNLLFFPLNDTKSGVIKLGIVFYYIEKKIAIKIKVNNNVVLWHYLNNL